VSPIFCGAQYPHPTAVGLPTTVKDWQLVAVQLPQLPLLLQLCVPPQYGEEYEQLDWAPG